MKFGYSHSAGRKHDLPVFVAERGSSSPRIIDASSCPLTEQVRMETVVAGAVSQRLRLNLG
jgi:hypothetical protein